MKQFLFFIILLLSLSFATYACDETIMIDSVEYTIDDVWCGKQIDTTLIAKYEDLARIPDSFCFKDYKIYIRTSAKEAFVKMAQAALKDSVFFTAKSGFRSPGYQARMIKRRLKEGKSFAEIIRFVAPPGYSGHSTGYALDVATATYPFAKSKAYKWLLEHAASFGFIETYPKGNATLKTWEPWHWEFIGDADSVTDSSSG